MQNQLNPKVSKLQLNINNLSVIFEAVKICQL